MRQGKSKRLEWADGVRKVDRILIFRPKSDLKIELLIVFVGRIVAFHQLHVDLAAFLATAGKVGSERVGRMAVLWDLSSSDINAVDGIHDILDHFRLGKNQFDVMFQTAVGSEFCEFSRCIVVGGADTFDEGLFRGEDHVAFAERLAFDPGEGLGDLVQNGLNLTLLIAVTMEQIVPNIAGAVFTNATEFSDKAIIGLGRKGFVAIASTSINIDCLGDIENVEFGTDFSLRHKNVGALLAFVGVPRLERKYEAVLVASRSASNNCIGQSVLGIERLGDERDFCPGRGIHHGNGGLFEEGTRGHDDVVGGGKCDRVCGKRSEREGRREFRVQR